MKRLHIVLWFVIVFAMFPAALLAQAVTPTPTGTIDLKAALAIVREALGPEAIILEITHDRNNPCWQFEFAVGEDVCVDKTSGVILPDNNANLGAVDETDFGTGNPNGVATPTVSLEAAIATAQSMFPNNSLTSVAFQMVADGTITWDIGLDNVLSLDIDAMTGEVRFSGNQTNDIVGTSVDNIATGELDYNNGGKRDDSDDRHENYDDDDRDDSHDDD